MGDVAPQAGAPGHDTERCVRFGWVFPLWFRPRICTYDALPGPKQGVVVVVVVVVVVGCIVRAGERAESNWEQSGWKWTAPWHVPRLEEAEVLLAVLFGEDLAGRDVGPAPVRLERTHRRHQAHRLPKRKSGIVYNL